jgi:ferrochelatase
MSFDAVLIVAFGGPQGTADVRPFLANVLRGRRVAPGRVEEVAHHYELFDGVSPLTELTMRQADMLRGRLHDRGVPLPVYVGMRNWHPFLADTLAEMSRAGFHPLWWPRSVFCAITLKCSTISTLKRRRPAVRQVSRWCAPDR